MLESWSGKDENARVLAFPTKIGSSFTVLWLLSPSLAGCKTVAAAPAIDFDARVHDFGTVNEGTVLKHVFTVKNTGNTLLKLTEVSASCGCTTATPGTREIAPGGSGPVEVAFDTRGFPGQGSKSVTIQSNDTKNPRATLEIKYNVERLLDFEKAFIRVETPRGVDTIEEIWLTGKLVDQAKLRVVKVEGHDNQFFVKPIEAKQNGKVKKGLELKLKGNRPVSRHGDITVSTGLEQPAELVLRFNETVS
jgi:hypothetical protein